MQNKEKHLQPTYQDEREGIGTDEKLEGEREGWNMQKLANQASQKSEDEIQRETLRGDETKGDANERDIAGNVDSSETPQGREEVKNDTTGKANTNG